MNKKQSKRQRDIKTKLMAAICMLLVSSIMMVSTTYAWFTLSTAPEVTGINTSVGANGNLEMALLPVDAATSGLADYGITSAAGDSTKATALRNVTWGNLVELSTEKEGEIYGMDKITLYPAKLNISAAGTLESAMLKTPAYGADGRVSELKADTVTSIYDSTEKNFPQTAGYGVRAIGVASGMTDRQLAYRNARSAANTSMSLAKTASSQSLNENGASLANIAVSHAANQGSETYTAADIDKLEAIVNDLLGVEGKTGVIEHIENAYLNYIIAFGASAASTMNDDEFKVFQSAVTGAADVYTAVAELGELAPAALKDPLNKLAATRATVTSARNGLESITATEGIQWADFDDYLFMLADMDAMMINGYAASNFRDHMSDIINKVTTEGLTVSIATGGGVYADIADHCGNFNASITIEEVTYSGMTLKNMTARMKTETTVSPVYLTALGTVVEAAGAPTGVGGQVMPISDFYGYVIDLAFRTNAAESNLLLQTEATDRIYSDNAADAETMGHGSTMTFASTTTDFTVDQLKSLMGAIRVVFFNPMDNNKVLGTAMLDLTEDNYTVTGGNTITAQLYLYKTTAAGTTTEYVEATYVVDDASAGTYKLAGEDETATHALIGDQYVLAEYIADADAEGGYRKAISGETATHAIKVTTTTAGEQKLTGTDAIITALTQNTATAVSALVYLDGENITNADVAATDATSMTGSMNLQFASSATLVPMEYTALQSQGTPSESTPTESTPTESTP